VDEGLLEQIEIANRQAEAFREGGRRSHRSRRRCRRAGR
jgi:hypothetical protein